MLKEVRSAYKSKAFELNAFSTLSESSFNLLQSVMKRYGSLSSWKLSSLSHEEFSWKKARKGLESSDDGDVEVLLDAMRVDATRELMNRKTALA